MNDEQKATPLKVAIVGKAPSTLLDAPYDDETWEIWTLSNNAQLGEAKRWSRHFEIHDPANFRDNRNRTAYWKWLCSEPADARPIYMWDHLEGVPASVPYPLDSIVERFGGYFNNTVSYLITLALLEGVRELALYGVDMAVGGGMPNAEYSHQRPSCEYFIGWARGMGVKCYVPPKSDLCKVRALYGFTNPSPMAIKLNQRIKELQATKQDAENRMEAAKQEVCAAMGHIEEINYTRQWVDE